MKRAVTLVGGGVILGVLACGPTPPPVVMPEPEPVDVTPAPPEPVDTSALTVPRPTQSAESGIFASRTVDETFDLLRQRMYAIGETTGELADWDAIMEEAALHIASRMEDEANLPELTAVGESGLTPLLYASRVGYHRIVEVLLQFDPVRQHVNDPDPNGMTPWQLSNVAQELTLAALNSTMVQDPFRIVPLLVKSPYFANQEFSPYHRTRALLEAAGADSDIETVREMIVALPLCPDDVKAAVRESDDILTTLRSFVIAGAPYSAEGLMSRNQ